MKIELTQGKVAIVDDEDYELVSKYNWFADCSQKIYYAMRGFRKNGKLYNIRMHRFIMNPKLNESIDHINSDGLDNRRTNLRIVSVSLNGANRRKNETYNKIPTKCIYKGVTKREYNRYESCIRKDKKYIYLGCFDTEIEAAHVYDVKARELFGEYSNLNFPV